MELLELKSAWDVVVKYSISRDDVDEFVVTRIIMKDSKTALSKIKRVMYFKFIFGGFTLIVGAVMIIGLFVSPNKFIFLENIFSLTENKAFLSSVVLFMAGMLTANYQAFKEIARFSYGVDLKSSLQRFIKIMTLTIKINIYSGAIFNSFALTWIFYVFAYRDELFKWNIKAFIVLTVSIVTFVGMYFLSRYEQKIKFGNHLNELKSQLKEIEDIDE